MTHLAVALAVPDTAAARAAMQRAAVIADAAELRLDLMQTFDLPALLADRPLPVIVTCRAPREGGRWQGSEADRLAVLRQAAALGADYVDLEWDVAGEATSFDRSRTRLILSRHDFSAMPADLEQQASTLWAAGADVVKLVGTASRLTDTAPVLRLLAGAQRPTIAIAMGEPGLSTRLLAFRYRQAFLSFGALGERMLESGKWKGEKVAATAPGQIDVLAMRDLFRGKAIGETTSIFGLLATDANRSPLLALGNVWLQAQGLDAVLVPLQPGPGEDFHRTLDTLSALLPIAGCLLEPPLVSRASIWLPGGDPELETAWPTVRLENRLAWLAARVAAR